VKAKGSNVFNNVGQRIGQVDQAKVLTSYAYDLAGQLTAVTNAPVPDPQNPSQQVSPITTYDYDAYGRLHLVHDANGHTTSFSYDINGFLHSKTDAGTNTTTYIARAGFISPKRQ
jgi:YD repeat-containing protein